MSVTFLLGTIALFTSGIVADSLTPFELDYYFPYGLASSCYNYRHFSPNAYDNSETKVKLLLEIHSHTFDEILDVVDVSLSMTMSWMDLRCTWRPSEDNNFTEAEFHSSYFPWTPEVIFESIEAITSHKLGVHAQSNGTIDQVQTVQFQVPCYRQSGADSHFSQVELTCPVQFSSLDRLMQFTCDNCVVDEFSSANDGSGLNFWSVALQNADATAAADQPLTFSQDNGFSTGKISFKVIPVHNLNYVIYIKPSVAMVFLVLLVFVVNPLSAVRSFICVLNMMNLLLMLADLATEPLLMIDAAGSLINVYIFLIVMNIVAFTWTFVSRQLILIDFPPILDAPMNAAVSLVDNLHFLFLLPPTIHATIEENVKSNKSEITSAMRKGAVDWIKCGLAIDRVCMAVFAVLSLIYMGMNL